MSELWLRFNHYLNLEDLPPVVYGELEGPGITKTMMVPGGPSEKMTGRAPTAKDWSKISVPGGLYFIYLTLPSGQRISTSIEIPTHEPNNESKPLQLSLEIPESKH